MHRSTSNDQKRCFGVIHEMFRRHSQNRKLCGCGWRVGVASKAPVLSITCTTGTYVICSWKVLQYKWCTTTALAWGFTKACLESSLDTRMHEKIDMHLKTKRLEEHLLRQKLNYQNLNFLYVCRAPGSVMSHVMTSWWRSHVGNVTLALPSDHLIVVSEASRLAWFSNVATSTTSSASKLRREHFRIRRETVVRRVQSAENNPNNCTRSSHCSVSMEATI